METQAFA
ncbi:hypothetical protein AVEN_54361-1, partial [Araneus ventricosus]